MPSATPRHRSLRSLAGILVAATAVASALLLPGSAANAWVPGTGHISGTVPQAAGHSGFVTVYDRLGDYVESGAIQADGSYDVAGLGTGDYSVLFAVNGFRHEWWQDVFDQWEATVVHVEDGQTTHLQPTLDPIGSISGTVLSEAGKPFASAGVGAYKDLGGGMWEPVEYAYTDEGGAFQIWLPDGEYRLSAFAQDAVHEFYDNVSTVAEARTFTVDASSNFTDIHARLALGAKLTGEIAVAADGYHEVEVAAFDAATDEQVRSISAYDEDADGDLDWTLGSLPSTALRIEYARTGPYGDHAGAYHHNVPESEGKAAATLVTLAPGEQRAGLHQTLVQGGRLSGRMVDPDGAAKAWCWLDLTDPAGLRSTRGALTSDDGTFTISGLSTGDYRLSVTGGETCDHAEHYTATDGHLTRATGELTIHVTEGEASSLPTDLVYGDPIPAELVNVSAPEITGTASVGKELHTSDGTWDPADVVTSRQWLRDGVPIDGATEPTYTLSPADEGGAISVEVTATREGYAPTSVTSAAVGPVAPAPVPAVTNVTAPVVSGVAKVGFLLASSTGTWSPEDVTLTRQWYRGNTAIQGATNTSYRVQPVDVGHRLHIEVVAARPGHTSSAASSASTAPVVRAAVS